MDLESANRRTAVMRGCVLTGALLASLVAGCGDGRSRRADHGAGAASDTTSVARATPPPPAQLQLRNGRRAPYLGVRCAKANSIACDTVGLAVWLKQPARSLRATIAGHHVAMRVPSGIEYESQSYHGLRGMYFEGVLNRPGLLHRGRLRVRPDRGDDYWAGGNPVDVPVMITAERRDGPPASVQIAVPLHAGWG